MDDDAIPSGYLEASSIIGVTDQDVGDVELKALLKLFRCERRVDALPGYDCLPGVTGA